MRHYIESKLHGGDGSDGKQSDTPGSLHGPVAPPFPRFVREGGGAEGWASGRLGMFRRESSHKPRKLLLACKAMP
jgi:hypothetical protein